MSSPWGQIDNVEKVCTGMSVISTPSHGGIRITEKLLKEHVTTDVDFITKLGGIKYGQYWYFEEDCAYCLVLFDCPRLLLKYAKVFNINADELFNHCKSSVKQWYPDYFKDEQDLKNESDLALCRPETKEEVEIFRRSRIESLQGQAVRDYFDQFKK